MTPIWSASANTNDRLAARHVDGEAFDDLTSAFRDLLTAAESCGILESDVRRQAEEPGGGRGRALRRVLAGSANLADVEEIGPVDSARLLVLVHRTRATPVSRRQQANVASNALCVRPRPEHTVWLLRNAPRSLSNDRALADARRIAAQERSAADTVGCAISPGLTDWTDLACAYQDAAALAAAAEDGTLVYVEQHWASLGLQRIRAHLDGSAQQPIRRLRDYDDQHSGHLLATLTHWLRLGGDMNQVAKALHLHPNTARYRVNRAAKIADLDLKNPLQVALLTLLTSQR
ncbi:MAG: hypothetical protein QOE58_1092 [Actinomycetota bacterium]|nr:hypothetical protein [Actinomycetota bacterium]